MMNMGSIADIDVETEKAVRAFIEKVASQYDLAGAILFGSRARQSHRPDSIEQADLFVGTVRQKLEPPKPEPNKDSKPKPF